MQFLDNSPQFSIRPMTESDIPEVVRIDQASFSLPWPERGFIYEVKENPNSIPLVAVNISEEGKNQIIGFIVVWIIIDEAHVGTFAILEEYRRWGIGEKILRAGLKVARKRGALQGFLEVRRGNEPAQKLYKKLGFVVDAIRLKYYQDNHEDALLMSLKSMDDL
jgi:[ribosomal protein S18]-alanine N-acetyltransferase